MVKFWFDQTHEIEVLGMGSAQCRIVRLPGPGSVGEQDGWLWDALAVCRRVTNQIIQEDAKRK